MTTRLFTKNNFLWLWLFILAVKVGLLPFLPMTPDETYYFAWAQNIQLSYFDHPPFISWIMWVGKFFWHHLLTIRFPGVVLCHLIPLIWYQILGRWGFSEKEKFLWLIACTLAPMSSIGGFIITPDVPFLFFWSLAVLYFENVLNRKKVVDYMLLGLWIGLGLLSKFNMVIFPLIALCALFYRKDLSSIRSWKFLLTIIVALIAFSPVIFWNYQNGFSSFRFQANHGLGEKGFNIGWPLELVGAQLLLWNPIAFIFGAIVLFKNRKNLSSLHFFALGPLLFFTLASLKGRPEANWPLASMPAWIATGIVYLRQPRSTKTLWNGSLILCALFSVLVISHSVHPWLPLSPQADRTHAARELLKDLPALENIHPLYARSYQLAAFYSYYRPEDKQVYKLRFMSRKDFYDYLPQSLPIAPVSWVVVSITDGVPPELQHIFTPQNKDPLPSGHILRELKRSDGQEK